MSALKAVSRDHVWTKDVLCCNRQTYQAASKINSPGVNATTVQAVEAFFSSLVLCLTMLV